MLCSTRPWPLALLVAAGCVCVPDPGERDFPCDAGSDCIGGFECVGGRCVPTGGSGGGSAGGGGGSGSAEADCANFMDDDGDGQTDCGDPDCNLRSCGTNEVCCGAACRYLPADSDNCGGCGIVCSGTQACLSLAVSGALTGACGCSSSTCPGSQSCVSSSCQCNAAADCASGEICDKSGGPGLCRYP